MSQIMDIIESQWIISYNSLVEFNENFIMAKKYVSLLVSMGPTTVMVKFLLVNVTSPYNDIL